MTIKLQGHGFEVLQMKAGGAPTTRRPADSTVAVVMTGQRRPPPPKPLSDARTRLGDRVEVGSGRRRYFLGTNLG
jgi:hypothetical protein